MRTTLTRIARQYPVLAAAIVVVLLAFALLTAINRAEAQDAPPTEEAPQGPPLHPTFPLLDETGANVLETGSPVSTMQTCGACHDTAFIVEHSFHADVGLSAFTAPGAVDGGRAWDTSPGLFGEWDPLTYRYLSPAGDARIDLSTAEWLQVFGARHAGGGPAVAGRDGAPLTDLPVTEGDPETHTVDPETGALVPWDWEESGVVEMNCFLCHLPTPNNAARIEALQAGAFRWANTATLFGTGIVDYLGGAWQWNREAFDAEGALKSEYVTVQDPSDANCGQCHGLVHVEARTPLVLNGCEPAQWSTITTGQIFSPQRLADTGMNLADKDELARSLDVHAERVLGCTDCHYALNNPIYYRESPGSQPEHLTFDPRRLDLGEYLYRPLHQFAKGQSAQGALAPEFDNSLRRCESCHSLGATHDWLPYKERHTAALSCETCHIPKLYAPARQYVDWTVLQVDGTPQSGCRGIEGEGVTFGAALITGYTPTLLPRPNGDGSTSLAPHNLITYWYWVYGDPTRPVPLRDLRAAWLDGDAYHPDVLAAFDADGDGALSAAELVIDTGAKEALITARLAALGLDNPRILGEVQPYSINHNVAHGDWATRDCLTCHAGDSRLNMPIPLANRIPGGVLPTLASSPAVIWNGDLVTTGDGALVYQPRTSAAPTNLYIFGHDSVYWIDLFGGLAFLGVIGGVSLHSGLRYLAARRRKPNNPTLRPVYMYSVYERQWHWLQTVVILGLIFTGLVIHKPETFGVFSFPFIVEVHNILALILVVNAALALFYHLASGEIRQFLPRPYGFFDQAFAQARFYLRGIFQGEEHPFSKTRDRKLNPLQQATYFAILNVLLPLQVITGALMWGAQQWPDLAARLGGLPFLAPLHTLIAWSFASFVVFHVYLTTTGPRPTTYMNAMITGWDGVETHETPSAPATARSEPRSQQEEIPS